MESRKFEVSIDDMKKNAHEIESSKSMRLLGDLEAFKKMSVRMQSRQRSQGEVEIFEAEEVAEDRRQRWLCLKSIGVPKRLRQGLTNLKDGPLLAQTKRFANSPDDCWCIVLSCGVGSGKSTAAAWWLWKLAEGRKPATRTTVPRWWHVGDLTRVDGFDDTQRLIAGPGALVIDDLGDEYMDKNKKALETLDYILNKRYENFRKTIITTNLKLADFRKRYGDRILDRIKSAETHGGGFFEKELPSMRGGGSCPR